MKLTYLFKNTLLALSLGLFLQGCSPIAVDGETLKLDKSIADQLSELVIIPNTDGSCPEAYYKYDTLCYQKYLKLIVSSTFPTKNDEVIPVLIGQDTSIYITSYENLFALDPAKSSITITGTCPASTTWAKDPITPWTLDSDFKTNKTRNPSLRSVDQIWKISETLKTDLVDCKARLCVGAAGDNLTSCTNIKFQAIEIPISCAANQILVGDQCVAIGTLCNPGQTSTSACPTILNGSSIGTCNSEGSAYSCLSSCDPGYLSAGTQPNITCSLPPVNGVCGTAASIYTPTQITYPTNPPMACASGNPVTVTAPHTPVSIAFPAEGASVFWKCSGTNGGSPSGTCEAKRTATKIDGACGPAHNKNYAHNINNYPLLDLQCSSGTSTNIDFPAKGGEVKWKCLGANDGTNSDECIAKRKATPRDGACGLGARTFTFQEERYLPFAQCDTPGIATVTDFPTPGNTVNWQCPGVNEGNPSGTCSASRNPAPITGACGDSARVFAAGDMSYPANTQCSTSGMTPSSTVFPQAGETISWTCSGLHGGNPSDTCRASKPALNVTVGTCGSAAGSFANTVNGYPTNPPQYCSGGTTSASPTFPTAGNSVNWRCNGINTTAGQDCSASKATAANPNIKNENPKIEFQPTNGSILFGNETIANWTNLTTGVSKAFYAADGSYDSQSSIDFRVYLNSFEVSTWALTRKDAAKKIQTQFSTNYGIGSSINAKLVIRRHGSIALTDRVCDFHQNVKTAVTSGSHQLLLPRECVTALSGGFYEFYVLDKEFDDENISQNRYLNGADGNSRFLRPLSTPYANTTSDAPSDALAALTVIDSASIANGDWRNYPIMTPFSSQNFESALTSLSDQFIASTGSKKYRVFYFETKYFILRNPTDLGNGVRYKQ